MSNSHKITGITFVMALALTELLSAPVQADVNWHPCPLLTGTVTQDAQCTLMQLPLDWEHPDLRTVTLSVKRWIGSDTSRPHKQIYLIAGGPGSPSAGFEPLVKAWSELDPSLDFYLHDPRGVGDPATTSKLVCPNIENAPTTENPPKPAYNMQNPMPPERWAACLNEIAAVHGTDYASHFTLTASAQDVQALVQAFRGPKQEAHVIGASYGTMVAIRYLQIAPAQATTVTLGSFGMAGGTDNLQWDKNHNDVGRQIFAACANDSFCNGKFQSFGDGKDPWAKLGDLLQQLKALPDGTKGCGGLTYVKLRGMLALFADNVQHRDVLPALVYRATRCSAGDQTAIGVFRANFFKNTTPGTPNGWINPAPIYGSEALQNVIELSELISLEPHDLTQVFQTDASLYFSTQLSESFAGYFLKGLKDSAGNPVAPYPRDQFFGIYPTSQVPVLLLNGNLDPSTPITLAREIARHFNGPQQYFFEVPRAGHGTFGIEAGRPNCTMTILQSFLANPKIKPQADCLVNEPQLDFHHQGNTQDNQNLFGQDDLWENQGA